MVQPATRASMTLPLRARVMPGPRDLGPKSFAVIPAIRGLEYIHDQPRLVGSLWRVFADGCACHDQGLPQRSVPDLVVEHAPRTARSGKPDQHACTLKTEHNRTDRAVAEHGLRRDHARGHEGLCSWGKLPYCEHHVDNGPVPKQRG